MDQGQKNKYIPLDAVESAVLDDVNKLLPRDEIYEPLAKLILQASERASNFQRVSFNEQRTHNAIFIDGARGTGKTAVLLNLKRYIEFAHKDLLANIHILDPIDPTLLEDSESLFLHIIVAAVLHDKDVKEAQRNKQDAYRTLNQALDKLAQSLEAIETAEKQHGIDKVRAMYSNRALAESVHEFFGAAASLLGKKLLILPIDDVDTSLNLAFENLEIIRRYLTTPYVLPIVSGDQKLYHEVTWRDFHGRLTKDSKELRVSARETALELADEYHRKVLPLPRRLTMPSVSSYWQWRRDGQNQGIVTIGKEVNALPLTNFISWLEIFLTGPVNGLEGSRLSLPIPSIRALTQLVSHCQNIIPELPAGIRAATTELEVRRVWQMPNVPLTVLKTFHEKHDELGKETKRNYAEAYRIFSDGLRGDTQRAVTSSTALRVRAWTDTLAGYFQYEIRGGAVFLILEAMRHWKNYADASKVREADDVKKSIFDTPLFQPLQHDAGEYLHFEKSNDLSDWVSALGTRLPEAWLAGIKVQQTILPYPVAEVGVKTSNTWNYVKSISSVQSIKQEVSSVSVGAKAVFLIDMLKQHNFYTNAKRTHLLNIGRIFELLINSIISPVSSSDIYRILSQPSFFSTNALAPTKTLNLDGDVERDGADDVQSNEFISQQTVKQLADEINEWRKTFGLEDIELSPWLAYKVFNKVFSQVASNGSLSLSEVGKALNIVAHTFYSTWAAFGSFEKGTLFGLPNIVATTNLNSDKLQNFENHDFYRINVGPFVSNSSQKDEGDAYQSRDEFGKATRSVTFCLASHPLRAWIRDCLGIEWRENVAKTTDRNASSRTGKVRGNKKAKEWLCHKLGIPEGEVLTEKRIKNVLADYPFDKREQLLSEMKEQFLRCREIVRLENVVDQLKVPYDN